MPSNLTDDPFTAGNRMAQILTASALGLNADMFKGWCDQFRVQFTIEDMSYWPIQPGAKPLQDQVTGQLYFVPGISDPGGPDILPPP